MPTPIDHELRALERRYWDAIQAKDAATAMALTDDKSVVVGAQGIAELDRAQLGTMLEQASYELRRYELDDQAFMVRKLTDDVAIVVYGAREDLIVDGKPERLAVFDASVWVRRGDRWRCALHTESVKGDPFGRDRKPAG
jgi:ketosteroid isomerase-like protein